MALTIRQHKIAALKHARKLLKRKMVKGLCAGINGYRNSNSCESNVNIAVIELRNYIQKVLGDNVWLNGWVRQNSKLSVFPAFGSEKMLQTRLNWIDWMIECLEDDEAYGHN